MTIEYKIEGSDDYIATKTIHRNNLSDNNVQDIVTSTELGDALDKLNDDSIDPRTNMSNFDMRARLEANEISSLLIIDTLVTFKFFPKDILALTRQKKRLSASLKGLGRREIKDISVGKMENDRDGGFTDKVKGLFGGGGGGQK